MLRSKLKTDKEIRQDLQKCLLYPLADSLLTLLQDMQRLDIRKADRRQVFFPVLKIIVFTLTDKSHKECEICESYRMNFYYLLTKETVFRFEYESFTAADDLKDYLYKKIYGFKRIKWGASALDKKAEKLRVKQELANVKWDINRSWDLSDEELNMDPIKLPRDKFFARFPPLITEKRDMKRVRKIKK